MIRITLILALLFNIGWTDFLIDKAIDGAVTSGDTKAAVKSEKKEFRRQDLSRVEFCLRNKPIVFTIAPISSSRQQAKKYNKLRDQYCGGLH